MPRGRPKKNLGQSEAPKKQPIAPVSTDVNILVPVSVQDYQLMQKEAKEWGVPLEALLAAVARSYCVRQVMNRSKK